MSFEGHVKDSGKVRKIYGASKFKGLGKFNLKQEGQNLVSCIYGSP